MFALFADLPFSFILIFTFIFGIIIGSFLNVYLYRLHTGKSLSGSSHCLSCATPLKFYELFPLFSYLALRGRCRSCGALIPVRYFLVELLTGVLFVGVVLVFSDIISIFLFWTLMAILVIIAVYDLYHLIIPDEMVLALLVVVFLYQFYLLATGLPVGDFYWNLLASFLGSLFLFLLWHVSKGKWIGFGDVKLVFPLALAVGYAGVFSMVVLSFWIGAVIGLMLLGLQKLHKRGQPPLRFFSQQLTIESAVPFAPFLILGCLVVLFFKVDVLSFFTYV